MDTSGRCGTTWAFSFQQRACFYEGFSPEKPAALLLYVGNESPLEVYINNTGLMWDLGRELGASLLFLEHRYEGLSVPRILNGSRDCLAYASSKQALADYALVLETLRVTDKKYADVPVVAFGGSYGGMLAAWIRARYPHLVAGSIAGSAPIFGIPTFSPTVGLDSSAVAIARGLTSAGGLENNFCLGNYEAAWVLVKWMAGGGAEAGGGGKKVGFVFGGSRKTRRLEKNSILYHYAVEENLSDTNNVEPWSTKHPPRQGFVF